MDASQALCIRVRSHGYAATGIWFGGTDFPADGSWFWSQTNAPENGVSSAAAPRLTATTTCKTAPVRSIVAFCRLRAWISGEPNGGTGENCGNYGYGISRLVHSLIAWL